MTGWPLRLVRAVLSGLRAVGGYAVMSPDRTDVIVVPPRFPPAAHPERLCPDVPPDEQERLLWEQLEWPEDGLGHA
jgi:uncharacterized protein DUF6059